MQISPISLPVDTEDNNIHICVYVFKNTDLTLLQRFFGDKYTKLYLKYT